MKDIKVQIKLRCNVELERDVIQLINDSGTRSGVPKQLLLAGYKALYQNDKTALSTTNEKETNAVEENNKPNPYAGFLVKG